MSSLPVHSHFDELHGVLGIYLTNRCNITCRHCGVNSGPGESSRLNVQNVVAALAEAAPGGVVKALHVNGGEPFMFRADLSALAAASLRLGLACAVNTNAYWARTEASARSVLRGLPGLTQLLISTDRYHVEFLPLERVRHAARAGVDEGLIVFVSICTPDGSHDEFVAEVERSLADVLPHVRIGVNPLEVAGRATALPEARWRRLSAARPRGACRRLNRPVVMEDQTVVACCNTTVSTACRQSPLILGNLTTASLSEIHDTADQDYMLQAVRALGPSYLAGLLDQTGAARKFRSTYPEDDICALCADIMLQPTNVDVLREVLRSEDVRREIATARAVDLGEPGMLLKLTRGNRPARPS